MWRRERKTGLIKRGDIYFANLDPIVGSEEGGIRPVLVLQNDVGNIFSPTIIIAPLTTKKRENMMSTHIEIKLKEKSICSSIVLLEQIRVIDKTRLLKYLGKINPIQMKNIDKAINISLGLDIVKCAI